LNTLIIASRNTGRDLQRTLVTTLSMAFACFIMIFFSSLMEGILQGSERQVVEMNMGDIQVHQKGYLDDPDIYATINDTQTILNTIEQQGFYAAPRLYAYGLLAANVASAGVQMRGINLDREHLVTKLYQHVEAGTWLDQAKPTSVVLGKKLAATLGVSIGDELIFIGQSTDGFMANEVYHVLGILKSVSDGIDRSGVFMLEESFRALMAMPKGVHEIVIARTNRTTELNAETEHLQQLLPEYEVKNWQQIMPVIAKMLEGADAQMIIMLLITYVAVATIILNAMLMTVFERMHEFGIMKAVGVSPWQIVKLIYAETLIQTFVASLLALGLGWWSTSYLQTEGIDMTSFMAGSVSFGDIAFDPVWYTQVTASTLATPIIFLFIIAMLAVIYPSSKAALIRPIDAIYFR